MLPTWRDVEIQAEIRNVRMLEATAKQTVSRLPSSSRENRLSTEFLLVRLGTWMVSAGHKLRSRYGDVAKAEAQMRSLEQGC